MTSRHPLMLLTAAVVGFAIALPAIAAEPVSQREDESRSIIERIKLYRERHGVNGVLDSRQMLERARWGYQRWLSAEQLRTTKDSTADGWVSLGPANGAGRMTAIATHPSLDGTVLAGAASGGVWKTTDGGVSWRPLTDGLSDLSVGALAIAPSNHDVVYLGSGEAGLGSFFVPGIGLLRSDDGGDTWFLPETTAVVADQFFALSVDPRDEDRLLAATEDGLYLTADAGTSWDLVLGEPDLMGITEIIRSSADPDRLWAALWCFSRCPDGFARVMSSSDGGLSWEPAAGGLPDALLNNPILNRIALAVAPSDDDVLYAALNTDRITPEGLEAAIYRSADGGMSWQKTGDPGPYLRTQGWYDNAITVDPEDPNLVVAAGVWYIRSSDGGASWTSMDPDAAGDWMGTETIPHVDGHAFGWQNGTLWLGCDGGVWSSSDGGATWNAHNDGLVTRQYYGLALDPIRAERILGGTQDNKTNLRIGPGNTEWEWVLDGDGFECAINPLVPDLVYGTIYGSLVFRSYDGGFQWNDVSPATGGDLRPFATPLTMRRDQPWHLYTGSSRAWHTGDAGTTWTALGTEVDDGEWSVEVVRSVAVTEADSERIVIGKGSAVYTSSDSGQSWRQSPMSTIVNGVAVSPLDSDTAIACLARTEEGEPQLLRSTDGGVTWHGADSGLPPFAVQVARWHPVDPHVVFAGTDVGLYRSDDDGLSWIPVGDGLPAVSVHDLRIADDGSRLVAATHGRGIWELRLAHPVGASPSVAMSGPALAVIGDPVSFGAAATDADGDLLDLRWVNSDGWQLSAGGSGVGAVQSTMEHTFSTGGRYVVAANAIDETNRMGFDSTIVDVYEPGDDCATPRVIPQQGPFPHTILTENDDATLGPDDPEVPCATWYGDDNAGRWASIWLELTPEVSGTYVFSTCGSRSDTVLSAWTGASCGPYEAVPDGCNDDDNLVNCPGLDTDSRLELELEAGTTVRVMVGAIEYNDLGRLRITVDCSSCRSEPDGLTLLIPAAAHTDGVDETYWTSDLQLVNRGTTSATSEIHLLPGPTSEAASMTREIPPGGALELDDVVADLTVDGGIGAIRIESSTPVSAASRTATSGTQGSYGQGIAPVLEQDMASDGAAVRLIGLASTPDYRTNLGLVNPGADPISLSIRLYDSQATRLAEIEQTLDPASWLQLNRVFESAGAGDLTGALAVVRQTSAGGLFTAYASVVDERTNDPTFVAPTDIAYPDRPLWIPAVAHAGGVDGAEWRSDLSLFNTSTGDVLATIEFIRSGGVVAATTAHVPKGWTLSFSDVVADALATGGSGALRITINRNTLMATSRTYAVTDAGSYGQGIPAIAATEVFTTDDRGLLPGLRRDNQFRTNMGFVNTGIGEIRVAVTAYAASGEALKTLSYRIGALSWMQANQALPPGTAIAEFTSSTPGAAYLAYASVVDQATDDPTYIAAMRAADR